MLSHPWPIFDKKMKYFILSFVTLLSIQCTPKKPDMATDSKTANAFVLPADTSHLKAVRTTFNSVYPIIVTKSINQTKDFYVKWFGCELVFESTWFVLLQLPGKNENLIAFIDQVHPSSPPSPQAFSGDGAFFTINVSDARALYNAFVIAKATFAHPLTDEPWGQKRFAITDPNGLWIDIVEQTQPKEGWWDEYVIKK
jgi:catechol 2,3-dioxygenase-like lactoylglutathione lyase family enzyme